MTMNELLASLLVDCCNASTGAFKWRLWVFYVGALLLLPFAAAQPGFISIDCGSTSSYTDERGIQWSPDGQYIGTGTNVKVTVPQADVTQQLSTARYFQAGRKRHCYVFPDITNNGSYLIRASFLYGDLATPLPVGYSFDVAIDSSVVWRVEIAAGDQNHVLTAEFFVAARSEEIAFCLLPLKGNPFISSLELRSLEKFMYAGYVFLSQYGVLIQRLNCGVSAQDPAIRYPDDRYDRVWESPGSSSSKSSVNTSGSENMGTRAFDIPPEAVMRSAWEGYDLWFTVPFTPYQKYYATLYFAEIRSLPGTDVCVLDILLNGKDWFLNLTLPADGEWNEIFNYRSIFTASSMNFSVQTHPGSTVPPLLNAYEVHTIYGAETTTTASSDRQVLDDFRHSLNLMDWTGDPCFPVSWDWLDCTSNDPATVTQIKLSNYQLHGTIPPSIGTLSALTDLWLDNNFITGSISVLGGLTKLRTLHLQNNSFSGEIPDTLANIPLLTELFLEDNHFNGTVPAALLSKRDLNLRADDSNSAGAHPQSSSPGSKSGSKGGAIGPIVGEAAGGVVVALLLVGALLYRYCLWKRRKSAAFSKNPNEASDLKGTHSVFLVDREGSVQNIRAFSLAEVNKITNHLERKIGEGGFGPVYFGRLDNGAKVAVKMNSDTSGQGRTEFYTEVSLLSRIHHRNLVHLVGFCDESKKRILIYEFMEGGMLREHLYGKGQRDVLDWPTRLQVAVDAARGLEYLHYDCHPRIIHRDVKSNNILLDENRQAKMIDFGISKSCEETKSEFCTSVKGTTGYLDPEYYSTNKLTYKSDVYAFGVVLLEIMSGRAPINKKLADQGQLVDYAREMLSKSRLDMVVDKSLGHNYNKEAMWKVAELAMRCVDPRSVNRPDMREVLKELVEATQYQQGIGLVPLSYASTSDFDTRNTTETFMQNPNWRATTELGPRDATQTFTHLGNSSAKPNNGFSTDPSHQRPNSETAAFLSNPGHFREDTSTAAWSPPAPR